MRRARDPEDARAKIVTPTTSGRAVCLALEQGLVDIEQNFARAAGTAASSKMRGGLVAYARLADSDSPIDRMFSTAAQRFVSQVLRAVHIRGHAEVSDSMLALFRTLEFSGSRLTDVACAARITKQSMRVQVERAERLGLVARTPAGADRRAKIIRFTPSGLTMMEEMQRGVGQAEAGFARTMGADFLSDLKSTLHAFTADS